MTHTTNIHAYAQIKDVLDRVVTAGRKARYDCGSARAATRFRQEAYAYRRLLEKENYSAFMQYSHLRLVIRPQEPHIILFEDRTVWGKLEILDEPFEYVPPPQINIETQVENLDDLLPENT